jgi:aryl-alcohol dehydrogenase-like predicted oxidoreductase
MSSSSTREPVLADQQGFIAVYPQGVDGPDGRTEKKEKRPCAKRLNNGINFFETAQAYGFLKSSLGQG